MTLRREVLPVARTARIAVPVLAALCGCALLLSLAYQLAERPSPASEALRIRLERVEREVDRIEWRDRWRPQQRRVRQYLPFRGDTQVVLEDGEDGRP